MANAKKNDEVKEPKFKLTNQNVMLIIGAVLVLIIIVTYIVKWQQVKSSKELNDSYLLDSGAVSLVIKNLDEVNQILTDSKPSEYFVFITYTGSETTNKLEKDIKPIIDKYNLSDSFYYLDVKSIMEEDNYLTRINNAFNTDDIEKVPVILYYKDDKLVATVKRNDDNCINAGDFQKILDIYEVKGQE